ncbi:MAG: hypothetical protein PHE43_03480 [Candidatus Nanoarchaeia archaeon]|nr:hypothetical protein [Candidatus Nanoarchaeia archaeon]
MKSIFHSRKAFYVITIIVLALWLGLSFVPTSSCKDERFGVFGIFHLKICNDMSIFDNIIYILVEILTLIGTAYLIISAVLYLKGGML